MGIGNGQRGVEGRGEENLDRNFDFGFESFGFDPPPSPPPYRWTRC